jgi:hypothetical protein
MKTKGAAFGPVLFVPAQQYIHHVPGYCILNKNSFPIHPGDGLSFGGIVLYHHLLKHYVFLSFAHGAKLSPIPLRSLIKAFIFSWQATIFSPRSSLTLFLPWSFSQAGVFE